jgi:DNA-binding XRE family transcriptional regulator
MRTYLTFPERMIVYRRRARLTQARLAHILGVSVRTIARIEGGEGRCMKRTSERFRMLEARRAKVS